MSRNTFRTIVLFIVGGAIGLVVYNTQISQAADLSVPDSTSYEDGVIWWNDDFAFRQKIVTSELGQVSFVINHASLVIDRHSLRDGGDLQVVKGTDPFQQVSTQIYNPDSSQTVVSFNKDSNDEYYLYYGSATNAQENSLSINSISTSVDNPLAEVESSVITTITKNRWFLYDSINNKVSLSIESKRNLSETDEIYVYEPEKDQLFQADLQGEIITFPIDTFGLGEKTVSTVVYKQGNVYRSNPVTFTISAPVFVAWTIDWEGIDPTAENIGAMERIANEFSIPMTQFFNPRVLMSGDISEFRRQDIVRWLNMRQNSYGDEIGMHMHMHHDMIEFAGIRPKENEPSWNGDLRGYDTPTTVYNYDELSQLFAWAQAIFTDYGLPEPAGYRAGGWFADETTLLAIEDAGFTYDSSGRKSFPLGLQGFIQPWTLDTTTQPYYPSYTDQNKTIEGNEMKLLEIPNNGGDSYWSSAQELIAHFYANYTPGTVLEQDQIVVYLSHPEWFEIDDPKLQELFSELSNFRYELDNGPVVFVTLEEYLSRSLHVNQLQ